MTVSYLLDQKPKDGPDVSFQNEFAVLVGLYHSGISGKAYLPHKREGRPTNIIGIIKGFSTSKPYSKQSRLSFGDFLTCSCTVEVGIGQVPQYLSDTPLGKF